MRRIEKTIELLNERVEKELETYYDIFEVRLGSTVRFEQETEYSKTLYIDDEPIFKVWVDESDDEHCTYVFSIKVERYYE